MSNKEPFFTYTVNKSDLLSATMLTDMQSIYYMLKESIRSESIHMLYAFKNQQGKSVCFFYSISCQLAGLAQYAHNMGQVCVLYIHINNP